MSLEKIKIFLRGQIDESPIVNLIKSESEKIGAIRKSIIPKNLQQTEKKSQELIYDFPIDSYLSELINFMEDHRSEFPDIDIQAVKTNFKLLKLDPEYDKINSSTLIPMLNHIFKTHNLNSGQVIFIFQHMDLVKSNSNSKI
jgi:hypothetical protein